MLPTVRVTKFSQSCVGEPHNVFCPGEQDRLPCLSSTHPHKAWAIKRMCGIEELGHYFHSHGVRERLRLEGTCGGHGVPPPCSSRVT